MKRSVVPEHIDDELDALLAGQSATVKDAAEDAEEYFRLMRALVAARRSTTCRQKDVAREMGTTQSAVSELENMRTDPQVSTLLRYARAVGCRVRLVASVQAAVAVSGPTVWQRSVKDRPVPRISKGRHLSLVDASSAANWRRTA
jgi:transcriptional regulator with XRE-family HTH domain